MPKTYKPSETFKALHKDDTRIRAVLGPIGSGKTVGCIMELFFRSLKQAPNQDGVRRTRWLLARQTYAELKSTTIKTFEEWLGDITTVVYDTPIRARIHQSLPDGTTVDAEFLFLAMEREEDAKKLKSLEITGAFINEASELPKRILEVLGGRVPRFPPMSDGGATWSGILMDTNPPTTRHWFYDLFEVERPKKHKLYKQPGGILYDHESDEYVPNPAAENISNHVDGYDYYLNQVPGNSRDYIDVFLRGQYGATFSGRPVFNRFSDIDHVSDEELSPIPGLPVIVGMDFGLQPAAVWTQLSPTGTLVCLDEVSPQDCLLDEFISDYVMPMNAGRYAMCPIIVVGDPSGSNRNAQSRYSAIQTLRVNGLAAYPASTNNLDIRLKSVNYFLNRRGGVVLSPSCAMVREALAGGYHFKKRSGSSNNSYKDTPEKNEFSHIADALQYACMRHLNGVASGQSKPPPPARKKAMIV